MDSIRRTRTVRRGWRNSGNLRRFRPISIGYQERSRERCDRRSAHRERFARAPNCTRCPRKNPSRDDACLRRLVLPKNAFHGASCPAGTRGSSSAGRGPIAMQQKPFPHVDGTFREIPPSFDFFDLCVCRHQCVQSRISAYHAANHWKGNFSLFLFLLLFCLRLATREAEHQSNNANGIHDATWSFHCLRLYN